MKDKTILAIETSCDETSIALVECSGGIRAPRFNIIKNIVTSQIPIHRPFGGVVPSLAKREHIKNLPIVLEGVLELKSGELKSLNSKTQKLKNSLTDVDLIAVTVGPGLEPALWTGIEFAKGLQMANGASRMANGISRIANRTSHIGNRKKQIAKKKSKIPLVGANHLEGHLYSFLAQKPDLTTVFPAIALIVSGGHTILLKMDSLTRWKKLGETRDDAAGEAFDKVAKMMGLPYPGGPEISKLATKGNPKAINFPRPMLHPSTSSGQVNYEFSFSGLKTAVLYYIRDIVSSHPERSEGSQKDAQRSFAKLRMTDKRNIAASFQQAVVDVLVKKTMRAVDEFGARSIILCGGVAANKQLQSELRKETTDQELQFFVPPSDLNGDNAAMIAIAAYINFLKKKRYKMEAKGNLSI